MTIDDGDSAARIEGAITTLSAEDIACTKSFLSLTETSFCCAGFEAEGFDWWKYNLRALVVSEGNDAVPPTPLSDAH